MPDLQPGPYGEPLPPGEWVLRLAVRPMDFEETGRASAVMFELSSADRESPHPRLSVWAERLTTPEQAWRLMDAKPTCQLVLRLNTDDIRRLRPEPDSPEVPHLDVVWEPLFAAGQHGSRIPEPRAGAEGHAGITGLARGGAVNRLHAKSLRRQLALLARVAPFRRPDNAG